jgi:molybdopterin converting factor small subunit
VGSKRRADEKNVGKAGIRDNLMATLKFLGFLGDMAKTKEMEISIQKSRKLRDLLPVKLPEDRTIVLINQEGAGFDSLVHNDDMVLILPVISGG